LGANVQKKDVNINLLVYIESARALLDIKDICNRAVELSEFNFFHLDGIVFGSDDFCANIGATRTPDSLELLLARQTIVVTAKAYDLQAIDLVHLDFKSKLIDKSINTFTILLIIVTFRFRKFKKTM